MSNKYKFIFSVTGMFLIPFLLLSRHFISGESELRQKDTLRYLELRTMTASGIVADVLNLNYSLARIAGGKTAAGTAALKKELSGRVSQNPFIYSELALLSSSGAELGRYSGDKSAGPKVDYSKSQAFEEARKTGAPAGAVEYGEYTPPALVIAEPLMKKGVPAYYAAGRLSLAYLGEIIRTMGRNSFGNFGLLDSGGQVIADSMSMSIVKPGLKAPPEVIKMLALAAGRDTPNFSSEVYFRGRTFLVSVSNVAGSDWWIYEIMDSADLPARKTSYWAWRIVISGILMMVFFGFLSYSLAAFWLRDGGV